MIAALCSFVRPDAQNSSLIGAPEGSSAAFLFLSALSLVSVAFCPFAAALALRVSAE